MVESSWKKHLQGNKMKQDVFVFAAYDPTY